MNAEIKSNENNTVSLEIKVDADQFNQAVQKAYQKNKGRFNIQGFRKGKAPRKIIEAHYGKGVFYEDAVEALFPQVYEQAIKELDIKPATRPQLEQIEDIGADGVTFEVKVGLKPDVKLGDVKGAKVAKQDAQATDQEINAAIDQMRDQNARMVSTDEAAKNGDTVNIDFDGYLDGEAFEGGSAKGHQLELGSGQFIPGFEEQLVGIAPGEERTIDVTFPENYPVENLAGKKTSFNVKANEVLQKELPELDDEFVKDVSEFDTLDELRQDVAERLSAQKKESLKRDTESKVLDHLIENSAITIPELMIDEEVESNIQRVSNQLKQQGLSLDVYLQLTGTDQNTFMKQMRDEAERNLKLEYALEAFADAENITADEDELEEEIAHYAKAFNKTSEAFKNDVMDETMADYIKTAVARRKAIDALVESAVEDDA